jgi:predicted transcriptional regulator
MARKQETAKPDRKALTPVELEMMNVLWRLGPCTVSQVREELKPERDLAYSSVSTIVRILEQKGYVTSTKAGRGHIYEAAVSRSAYQVSSLENLLSNVFGGEPSLLVQRLLDTKSLTVEEIAQIKGLLASQRKQPK